MTERTKTDKTASPAQQTPPGEARDRSAPVEFRDWAAI